MDVVSRIAPLLERQLLRKAVHALQAGEERCTTCRRTPLIGESVHRYADGQLVCELCRPLRAEAPQRIERIRGTEHGQAVRLAAPRAA